MRWSDWKRNPSNKMSTNKQQFSESDGSVSGSFRPKWPSLPWHEVVEKMAPITFRVYAGDIVGTAFIVSLAHNNAGQSAILATAWHVIEDAASKPIDVQIVSSDRRTIFDTHVDEMRVQQIGSTANDTGLIFLKSRKPIIEFGQLVPILDFRSMIMRGTEVGWLGFPGLADPEICFFHGYVSAFLNEPPTYLIDGVAISGVSGGPVFDDSCHLIGLVSAYLPNRVSRQTTLPGMSALMPINAINYFMQHNMNARVV
jgi:hypothetical protein